MRSSLIQLGLIALAVAVAIAAPLSAFACCTAEDAKTAFMQGDFTAAYERAAPLPSADAKLIAVEALAAQLLLGTAQDPKRTAKTAMSLAADTLNMDPSNKDALLQYTLIDGFVTRAASPFKAYRKKLPQKTKAAVDALLLAAPEDGRAHALLGAWHIGIVRKAGEKNAKKLFGATFPASVQAYESALTLHPEDIIISSNYALSLLEYDADTYSDRAQTMLMTAVTARTDDPIEKAVQARMRVILNLWATPKARVKSAKSFLDGTG